MDAEMIALAKAFSSGDYLTDQDIDATLTQPGQAADAAEVGKRLSSLSEEKVNLSALSLGFGTDGKLYIMVSGVPTGSGVEINGTIEPSEGVVVFAGDFSGASPSTTQFYAWTGREYQGRVYDSIENIQCSNGTLKLTSIYDENRNVWVTQMISTAGLFESDEFICRFKAKFSGLAGSWQNVITYGTGIYWTNGMYSDGLPWAQGGEIDAFEQAGGYADNPNYMIAPTVHYGVKGATSSASGNRVEFTTDEWHDFVFSLKNGVIKTYIDGTLVGELDTSSYVVNSDVLFNYKPFLHPQAFYIDGQEIDGDTANEYVFEVSDFEIIQDANVRCEKLKIYPQMWTDGTELVFPVGAELFFEKEFTPANTSNKACQWESSNLAVATVVQGHVKCLTVGSTTITATCNGVTASYSLEVSDTAAQIPCVKMETAEQISGLAGTSVTLADFVTVYPSFATDVIQYSVDNTEIATVADGQLTLNAEGECVITVTCGNHKSQITVISESALVLAADLPTTNESSATDYISFATGGQYTVSFKISENSIRSGTANNTIGAYAENSGSRKAPYILFTSSGVQFGMAGSSPVVDGVKAGDWLTVVFTLRSKQTWTLYVNGVSIKTGTVYPDYFIKDAPCNFKQDMRPDAVPTCCERVEVYHGDMHSLYA